MWRMIASVWRPVLGSGSGPYQAEMITILPGARCQCLYALWTSLRMTFGWLLGRTMIGTAITAATSKYSMRLSIF